MIKNAIKHFRTITYHKYLVMKGCFKVGLYRQGLMHDLSKYMPSEFMVGVRYYQGNRSPNNAEREEKGYSSAWLHHKGRNKHHYEYWIDYNSREIEGALVPAPMPVKYVIEMVMDRIAASKVYQGKAYTDKSPLEYLNQGKNFSMLHPKTYKQLKCLLTMLANKGEDYTFHYIRTVILKKK